MNRSTYIPDKLLLLKENKEKDSYCIYYISPDGKRLVPNPMEEGYYSFMRKLMEKYGKDILSGKIPEKLLEENKSIELKFVPNTPFRPEIHGMTLDPEDNVSFKKSNWFVLKNPDINLIFTKLSHNYTVESLIRLGVERDKIGKDAVVAYTFSPTYSEEFTTKDPNHLILIESSGPYYEDIKKRSDWMREKCPETENLEVGKVYQFRGEVEIYNYDKVKKSRQAVYLGKLKFANDTITGGGNPGKKYTNIDCWLSIDMWNNPYRVMGAPLTIFTIDEKCVLCQSYDYPDPFPKNDLEDVLTRFKRSMWSSDFWRTNGIIREFSPFNGMDKDLLDNWSGHHFINYSTNTYTLSYSPFPPETYSSPGGIKEIKTVVKKEVKPTDYWYNRLDRSYDSVKDEFIPVTLSSSDPLLPLQVIPSKDSLNNWLGGDEWRTNEGDKIQKLRKTYPRIPDKLRGIKYTTTDGYTFYETLNILLSSRSALWKTQEPSHYKFREWSICGKV